MNSEWTKIVEEKLQIVSDASLRSFLKRFVFHAVTYFFMWLFTENLKIAASAAPRMKWNGLEENMTRFLMCQKVNIKQRGGRGKGNKWGEGGGRSEWDGDRHSDLIWFKEREGGDGGEGKHDIIQGVLRDGGIEMGRRVSSVRKEGNI